MIKLFCVILLSFLSTYSFSQLVEVERRNIDAESFYIDKLENFYFKKNNSIFKTDKNFSGIATYDSKAFGNISYVDVSNPFTTLLFYKDINRLVYLDNYLVELRDPILFDDLQLYNVDVVCSSSQGGFWAYDVQNSQVCLINKDLVKVQQGVNLYSIVESANARSIVESNNFIFLLFDPGQIIVLDKFGSFYKNLKSLKINYFDVFNDMIYLVSDTNLEIMNIQTNESIKLDLPDIRIEGFKISGSSLYFLSENFLIKYKIL